MAEIIKHTGQVFELVTSLSINTHFLDKTKELASGTKDLTGETKGLAIKTKRLADGTMGLAGLFSWFWLNVEILPDFRFGRC